MTSKLTPNDPRAVQHTAKIRGKTYYYVLASPSGGQTPKGTIILIHGFPDLGFGWRYQVPMLAEELGLQVIVPDMLGYGQTDAPESAEPYAYKSICEDLVALVDHVGVVGGGKDRKFFVGGHDWGGAVAWRMALWHADRLCAVFSVCTPFFAPSRGPFTPLSEMVKSLPNFGYQKQFASDELYKLVGHDETRIRQFLQTLYGGRATDGPADPKDPGSMLFNPVTGIQLDRLSKVGPTPLLSASELDYYVKEYTRHGLQGPTNWYRTYKYNYDDERPLVEQNADNSKKIEVPSFMLSATGDSVLLPILTEQMGKHFTNLIKGQAPGSHWVLWQSSAVVNEQIKNFLSPLIDESGPSKAAL